MRWIKFTNPNLIVFYLFAAGVFSLVIPAKQVSATIYVESKEGITGSDPGKNSSLLADNTRSKTNNTVSLNKQTTPVGIGTTYEAQSDPDSVVSNLNEKRSELGGVSEEEIQAPVNDKQYDQDKVRDYKKRNYLFYKIFGEERLLDLKNEMLNYGRNHFAGLTRFFYSSLIDQLFSYPVIIVFTFLIFFFIAHILFVLMVLNYSSQLKNNNERYIRIYRDYYERITLSYLFDEMDWNTYVSRLKKFKKHKNRKILISILLNLHDNLKGGFDAPISQIYAKLQLEKDSYKSIHSFLYHHKVSGLHELTNLYPSGAIEVLPALMNHSNESVRSEAQKAYILLHPEKPFDFLRTLDKSFSRWTQLSAFNLLRLPHLNVPSFSRYIRSKHHDVRIFCMQMIIYFQQLENISLIFYVLESRHELIRFLAYEAINDLRLFEGRSVIKNEFRYETERNKKEIVKALCNIGTDEDIDFLEIIFKSESIALQIEACRTLYYMSPESRNRLLAMRKEAKSDLDLFVAHITDSRN
ncbi:hypothetical protein [uncultured Draconibacterium sp.]|uniref:HEAT repeat domain-containing protein n=1 Tax=uncultured Draconibacterium sp. TaxID=1573823 RepID=UPI00321788FE